MTVRELKEALEELDENMEIIIAQQPSYPLYGQMHGITWSEDENTAIICSGAATEYGRKVWWDAAEDFISVEQESMDGEE